MVSKRETIFLIALIAISIIVVLLTYPKLAHIGTDGTVYAQLGANLADGQGLTMYGRPHTVFSPLFPLTMVPFMWLALGNADFASHATGIFWGLASIIALYFVARKFWGRKTAALSSLFLAFSGNYVLSYSTIPSPQILGGFISILVLYLLLLNSKKVTTKRLLLLGFAIAAAYLTRPEYIVLLIPAFIFVAYFADGKVVKRSIKSGSLLLIGFLIIATPYLSFLKTNIGSWSFTGRSVGTAQYIITGVDDSNTGDNFIDPATGGDGIVGAILGNLPSTTKRFFTGIRDNERTFVMNFGLLATMLMGLGLFNIVSKKKWREIVAMAIVISPVAAVALVIEGGKTEYLVQYFFLFYIFAGIGTTFLYEQLSSKLSLKHAKKIVAVVLILVLIKLFFPLPQSYFFLPKDHNPRELSMLGIKIRQSMYDALPDKILDRKPNVSFYAGSEFVLLPKVDSIEELEAYMVDNGFTHVVISERNVVKEQPILAPLLEEDSNKLHRVIEAEEKGKKAVLFELQN